MGRSTKKKKKKMPKKKPGEHKELLASYDISMRTHERRAALTNDAQFWGVLRTLKQLNTVREAQQWNPRVHEILTKDLEYLQKTYQRTKIE